MYSKLYNSYLSKCFGSSTPSGASTSTRTKHLLLFPPLLSSYLRHCTTIIEGTVNKVIEKQTAAHNTVYVVARRSYSFTQNYSVNISLSLQTCTGLRPEAAPPTAPTAASFSNSPWHIFGLPSKHKKNSVLYLA